MTDTTIKAEAHSDDHVIEIEFDAAPWFTQASDQDIMDLAKCEWGGDYPADEVALHFSATATKRLFDYLALRPSEPLGFECHVDEDEAISWLMRHRPTLGNYILDR